MSKTKKAKKVKLDDKEENVSPPWEAWYHPEKNRKFYVNAQTNKSVWEHPNSLKVVEDVSKQAKNTRKRREPEKKDRNIPEDELMEVDLPPPPKRRTSEQLELNDQTSKRARKNEERHEILQTAPKIVEPDKIFPIVSWKSKIRPFYRLPYRGCAIFDTCALVEYPHALTASIDKQLLTVIPYTVHSELDGLKRDPKTYEAAKDVTARLKKLLEERNCYLLVETSVEQKISTEGFCADESVKDDVILKCALRIKAEVMSIAPKLNLNERAVLLVTNDNILANKAMTHGLTTEEVFSFMEIINGNERPSRTQSKDTHRKKSSASQKTETPRTLPPVPNEPSTHKKIAIEKIKNTRQVTEWIHSMAKKVEGRDAKPRESSSECTPTRPRPSIPLEDEVIPSIKKTVKEKKPYTQLAYQTRNNVKSNEPSKPRPKMPCSLSDEDDDECRIAAGDQMDCT